jgi:hypothetical protein
MVRSFPPGEKGSTLEAPLAGNLSSEGLLALKCSEVIPMSGVRDPGASGRDGNAIISTMPNLRNLQLAPLKDEDEFENLCLALWKRILHDPNAQPNGRRGQAQRGVDLFGRRNGSLDWVGIQCKVRTKGVLATEDVDNDVALAKTFNPHLTELVFATTAPRDEGLQEYARILTESSRRDGLFSVSVSSWGDILLELSEERNLDLCHRFFEGAMINCENLGIAISRVVRLSVGVAGMIDSTYELLLGRTPSPETSEDGKVARYDGRNYWKGSHFIADLNGKTIDTFPTPTYPSDLEQVFKSKRDAYVVAKWLTASNKQFTEILYGEVDEHACEISEEEFSEFLSRSADDDEDI